MAWHDAGKRVDVYFNNDLGGHAVRNARRLRGVGGPRLTRRNRGSGTLVKQMRAITLISTALLAVAGCSGVRVVNNGEPRPETATNTETAPPLPPTNTAHLANAFDYVAHPNDEAAYYFTTPSGRWQCAILPRVWAGCQSAGGALGIAGAPDTVPDSTGAETTPNAVVIEPRATPISRFSTNQDSRSPPVPRRSYPSTGP